MERVLSDTGTVLASYTYDAWGSICQSSGSFANINPIRYRSYYYDTEISLYYLQSRYYNPQVGRFVNADGLVVVTDAGYDLNLYCYCSNQPINNLDYAGSTPETILDIITLGYSLVGVVKDPSNPINWVIMVLDIVDVGVPGVCGLGEAVRVANHIADKKPSSKNFRKSLQDFTGESGVGMEAHHVFPQAFRADFKKIGLEIDDPIYGSWVPKDIHNGFSYEYNQDWRLFLSKDGPTRTKQDCFDSAKELSKKYGFTIYFKN